MTFSEEAVKAAIAAYNKYYDDLAIYPSEEPTPEGAFHAALKGALPFLPVQGAAANACPCTKIQQDETCPVGYPSLLCEICDGKGVVQPSAARELALEEAADEWSPLKQALWRVLMDEKLNEGHYIAAFPFVEKLYAAAIRALSSPDHSDAGKVEGDGWLSIESAPKDKMLLLACVNWAPVEKLGREVPIKVGYQSFGRWTIFGASWTPTHWRPLPTPPSSEVA
jgi:hypothetical protein